MGSSSNQAGKTAPEHNTPGVQVSHNWYRDLVEHSQDLLCTHDLQGRLLSASTTAASLVGYSVEELLQIPMADFIAPEFRNQFDSYLSEIQRTGEAHGLLAVLTRSGERRIWEYHNKLQTEGVESPIVRGIARDVTEQKRAERMLSASEQRFRALYDQSSIGISLVDPRNGRILQVNPKYCEITGRSEEQLKSLDVPSITHPDDVATSEQRLRELAQGRTEPFEVEKRYVRPDGSIRWANLLVVPMWAEGKRPTCVMGVLQDITERKQAEEALWQTKEQLQLFIEHAPVALAMLDREMRYLCVSHRYLAEYGRGASDLRGVSHYEIFPEIPERWKESHRRGLAGEVVREENDRFEHPDGSARWIRWEVRPWNEANGEVGGIVIFSEDITERKQAEEALRASEAKYRRIVDTASEGIWVSEGEALVATFVNARMAAMLGYQQEEMIGRPYTDFIFEEDLPDQQQRMENRRQGISEHYERRFRRKDGQTVWAHVSAVPILDEQHGCQGSFAMFTDITERKRLLAQIEGISTLRESLLRPGELAAKLRAVTDSIVALFKADFARIWIVRPGDLCATGCMYAASQDGPDACRSHERCLHLIASSGRYTHTDGAGHRRVPFGAFKIGQVASGELAKFITNSVVDDPRIHDQAWARELGLVAFAGYRLSSASGEPIGVMALFSKQPISNEEDALLAELAATVSEVILASRAEEALRNSEAKYRRIVDTAYEGIWVSEGEADLVATFVNARMAAMLGYQQEEMIGRPYTDFIFEEDLPDQQQKMENRRAGMAEHYERRLRRKDGQTVWAHVSAVPILDEQHGFQGSFSMFTDITERKRIEEELRQAKDRLTEEKLYLEQEINTDQGFDDIVGSSKAIKNVMEQVAIVADSNATVLLLGETGTGKELFARAVHRRSKCQGRAFIKMNCAAIPTGLLESELFGYEKGAFTGAVGRKAGRVELADKGTLFLDEIGEIPLALQPKLLRLLQDHEFERLGGTRTLRSDFRLIAATNRDLLQSVNQGQFRRDLYYRLNVFPIRVPSLRERREDIPSLVEYFVRKFGRRLNKSITSIPQRTMESLTRWDWPGNVRELENFIERSVILTKGSVLACPLNELWPDAAQSNDTLETVERKHILSALRESRGQLSGSSGAAARLGLKRTTLQSKLKQFGIDHRQYREDRRNSA